MRAGDPLPDLATTGACGRVIVVPRETRDAFAALDAAAADLPPEFVFLAADRILDGRVLRALRDASGTMVVTINGGAPEPIGRATIAEVRAGAARRARRLEVGALDPYVPELRGEVRPFVIAVRSAADRAAAWRLLLDGVQKRTLDLPGRYFDTPFENALVRLLAPTRVTPNQITAVTTVVAGVTGVLFLHGWLRVGLALALLVGILDGVDGKLARLKLATSRMGTLEHVTDFFYENFWYLALATYLSEAGGGIGLWHAGLVLSACDFLDNLVYLGVRLRTGRMLDELSPFDRRFRAVAGRRNVYVMIFAAGFLSAHATGAFVAASCWAAITVAVHAARLVATWREPVDEAPPLGFQVSEAEPASAVLLNEK